MSVELAQCPFCGRTPIAQQGHAGITYFCCDGCSSVVSFRTSPKGSAALAAYAKRYSAVETGPVLPSHLRDDAPYKQCSECGRKSWEDPEHEAICWLPQPSGEKCPGVLRLAKNR